MSGNSLGIAFLDRSALDQWQHQLDQLKLNERQPIERAREQFLRANQSEGHCLACDKEAEIETSYLETLFQGLADTKFEQALRSSEGLCRPHFIKAGHVVPDGQTLALLLEIEGEVNRRLLGELDELIRKNNFQFAAEGFGPEADSWVRGIEHLSGAKDAV